MRILIVTTIAVIGVMVSGCTASFTKDDAKATINIQTGETVDTCEKRKNGKVIVCKTFSGNCYRVRADDEYFAQSMGTCTLRKDK